MMVYSDILMCEELGWIQFSPVSPLTPFIPPQLIDASYTPVRYDKVKIFASQDIIIPISEESVTFDAGLQIITDDPLDSVSVSVEWNRQTNFKVLYKEVPSHGFVTITIQPSLEHEIHIRKDDYIADLTFINHTLEANVGIAEF
jgi:hypothetical protein